jgi:hypothetical protein
MGITPFVVFLAYKTPVTILFPLVWLSCGLIIILAIIKVWTERRDHASLILGAIVALALRASLGWVLVGSIYESNDTRLYWEMGTRFNHLWQADRLLPLDHIRLSGTDQVGYFVWVGLHMFLQRLQYLVICTNTVIGIGCGLLAYAFVRLAVPGDRNLPRRVAWMMWLSTAMILNDSQNLRDTISVFLVIVTMIGIQRLTESWSWKGFLTYFIGILLLIQIRSYIAMAFLPITAVALLLVRKTHKLPIFLVFVGITIGVFVVLASTDLFVMASSMTQGYKILDMLQFASVGLSGTVEGGSMVYGLNLQTWSDFLTLIPLGTVHALFSPLPWKVRELAVLLIPDAIVRFALMPFVVVGTIELLRRNWRGIMPSLIVMTALIVLYAIIEIGGNIRHNGQWFIVYYMLAVAGIQVYGKYKAVIWTGLVIVTLPL